MLILLFLILTILLVTNERALVCLNTICNITELITSSTIVFKNIAHLLPFNCVQRQIYLREVSDVAC